MVKVHIAHTANSVIGNRWFLTRVVRWALTTTSNKIPRIGVWLPFLDWLGRRAGFGQGEGSTVHPGQSGLWRKNTRDRGQNDGQDGRRSDFNCTKPKHKQHQLQFQFCRTAGGKRQNQKNGGRSCGASTLLVRRPALRTTPEQRTKTDPRGW